MDHSELMDAAAERPADPPPLDVAVLMRFVGDDPVMLNACLADYAACAAKAARDLTAAIKRGDATAAGMVAYRLKSSSRAVGASALAKACAALEAAARARDIDELPVLLGRFTQEYERVRQRLASLGCGPDSATPR